jgi:hypothetical protein
MALWAAQRHDVPLERTGALALKRFRAGQSPEGSWDYDRFQKQLGQPATMTCAGLQGLAVGHGLSTKAPEEARLDKDPAVERAFQLLGQYVGEPGERPEAGGPLNLYFLWSLERVAVLYNRKTIAGKDWYAWGEKILLDSQKAEGHWEEGGYPGSVYFIDTCFAVMFLKRTNLARDLSVKLQVLGANDNPED